MPFGSLQELVVIVMVGWPAILASLLLALGGLVFKKWVLLVVGGLVALPFSIFYMGAYFNLFFVGALLTLGHFASAFSVYKKRLALAWVLILPFTVLAILLAYVVLMQPLPF
jgi:hypothetical protein